LWVRFPPGALSFEAFAKQRQDFLTELKDLDGAGWQRDAAFQGAPKPRRETVFNFARRMALYERGHWEQIEALLA
jgi:hypothetical protein